MLIVWCHLSPMSKCTGCEFVVYCDTCCSCLEGSRSIRSCAAAAHLLMLSFVHYNADQVFPAPPNRSCCRMRSPPAQQHHGTFILFCSACLTAMLNLWRGAAPGIFGVALVIISRRRKQASSSPGTGWGPLYCPCCACRCSVFL